IGVRKALGATTTAVLRQFFLEGFFITLISGTIGMGVALAICAGINTLPMPNRFKGMILSPEAAVLTVASLVVIGIVTALYPARRAAEMPPVDALRYEMERPMSHSASVQPVLASPGAVVPSRRRFRGPQVFIEICREAFRGLSRNRFRAGLAMLGISWGIVSVVMLLAYGNGFRDALAAGVANPLGRGVVISWPGQTSMQAGGERAGRRVRVTVEDALQLAELPLVKAVSPEVVEDQPVSFGTKQSSYLIRAVAPAYGPMRTEIPLPGGRFLDDEDVRLHRRVAFIGSEVNRKLFGESNAVGQSIRIRGLSFEVIGVMKEKAQLSNYFRSDVQCVFIPYTVASQVWYQPWSDVIVWQAVDASQGAKAEKQVSELLG